MQEITELHGENNFFFIRNPKLKSLHLFVYWCWGHCMTQHTSWGQSTTIEITSFFISCEFGGLNSGLVESTFTSEPSHGPMI